ncbi:Tripartite tricarboxylate transporter family receptor [Pigmentiphaga humi]|uniref:Tripartite tricarboxylate transporter family receptor n=1 Tax=Pigmentiphaga humi TaxID=2478468 RepID=A0A3P4B4C8_9BURK|nr:tripartite tricarboxylate transporter substrate binding protein [Pigmentiphaga humi]VCU71139.1 Tripartite tricarboxylate transporter family receptor [Pigmentiphaga humi]
MIALLRPFAFALSCVALAALAAPAQAQDFPSRPITIIVGYPPGGGPDIGARMLGEKLAARLHQPVIVENRAGVSGMIGAGAVARAPADGYTLLFAPNTFLIAPHVLPKGTNINLDVLHDFAPVIAPSKGAMIMVAHPSLGVHNAKELVALLKKQPGLAYATPGSGSPMHIAGELFKKSADVNMLHVPYKGVAPALADVVGGHVKITYAAIGVVAPHIAAGRLVALGAAEKERSPLMPELPTLAEQGFPNTATGAWYGVFAPKGTPAAVVDKLNKEFNAALQMPDTVAKLKNQWEVPLGGSPEDLARMAKAEYEDYGKIIKAFNISAD